MIGLLVIGFFAGVIAGVSPCILPILPVVLVGWSAPVADTENPYRARRRRAVAVVIGLVCSFSLITALGSIILSSLGLPQDLLRTVGIVLLVLFGVGLLWPRLEVLLERPFTRLAAKSPTGTTSGFLLGLGLGFVFVPCAGPVLAAISVLGARHHASAYSVLLSFFFGAGATTPLLAIALAGDRIIERNRALSSTTRRLRPVAGGLLIAMALAITFNLPATLQRDVPGYTQSLQQWIEGNSFTVSQLRSLQNQKNTGSLVDCENTAAAGVMQSLGDCGTAPNFTGITAWLNTPGNKPLTLASLRGKVVLVDFWTYSCINCQRTLPHVEAWYSRYKKDGLVVIGVEAPEFAFEHVISNIAGAAKQLGVDYPIAVDDNLSTWNAYLNQYWPAEYLIDASGVIRHVSYGEGNYVQDEQFIRTLLRQARPGVVLPPATNVPNLTPTEQTSPETYLGTERSQYMENDHMQNGLPATYALIKNVAAYYYALGGTWTPSNEAISAGSNAQLSINFRARDVYLVLGGTGTVTEMLNGQPYSEVHVAGIPTLYTLVSGQQLRSGILTLSFTPGIKAYDFTFG
jgi:cytochrome c biogenesis protein CcdA/thiol-disulfide isomerase/thioredoxin